MARPTKTDAEKRNQQTNERWTLAELLYVDQQAKMAGLSRADFIRFSALEKKIVAPPRQADAQLLSELNRIGVNVNQLARDYNSDREFTNDWRMVRDRLLDILDKVARAYDPQDS